MRPNNKQLDDISTMMDNGNIKPAVDKVYAFEKGTEAYSYLANGRAKGKMIITLP
jgi:NADPH:quinone reductase-like Zn-dependent oxidoreductase